MINLPKTNKFLKIRKFGGENIGNYKKLPLPGFEPGFSEPQSEVLTTILQ